MADAVIRSGGEMEPEQHQRTEKTSAGFLGAESNRGAAEDTTQNGGRSESGSAGETLLVAAVAAEDKVPTNLSISSSSQRRSSISTANEQQQQPPSGVLGGPPPLPKPPEDQQPLRRNFQIPRKSREKKGCSFPSPPFSTSRPTPSVSSGRSQTPHTAACKPCGVEEALLARTREAAGEPILLSGFFILSLPLLFSFSLLFCHEDETKPNQNLGLNFRPLL